MAVGGSRVAGRSSPTSGPAFTGQVLSQLVDVAVEHGTPCGRDQPFGTRGRRSPGVGPFAQVTDDREDSGDQPPRDVGKWVTLNSGQKNGVNHPAARTYIALEAPQMTRWLTSVWTAGMVLALVAQLTAGQKPTVDVTGAWAVTITRSSGGMVTGLAILSQDGSKITGMIGPAETEMMPAEGAVDGNKVTLLTRPRTGRTAAFAKSELTATAEKMTGTIDTDKGTIELIRKQRPSQPAK